MKYLLYEYTREGDLSPVTLIFIFSSLPKFLSSGLIGRAWSMLFASVGYKVMLYDILPEQLSSALEYIDIELHRLEEEGLLRGHLNAEEQFKCIKTTTDIKELTRKAVFIQECIPERIEWKKSLYQQLDDILEEQTIVSSSTSTFMPSLFSEGLKHRHNVSLGNTRSPMTTLVEISNNRILPLNK